MRASLKMMAMAGVVAIGGLLGAGATPAKAQVIVATPGLSVGVGAPLVGGYPGYYGGYPGYYGGAYPGYYGAYPVRPYPYGYARPGYYGGYRGGYGGGYYGHRGGYRR